MARPRRLGRRTRKYKRCPWRERGQSATRRSLRRRCRTRRRLQRRPCSCRSQWPIGTTGRRTAVDCEVEHRVRAYPRAGAFHERYAGQRLELPAAERAADVGYVALQSQARSDVARADADRFLPGAPRGCDQMLGGERPNAVRLRRAVEVAPGGLVGLDTTRGRHGGRDV